MTREEAAKIYLRAKVARRDAEDLIEFGYWAAAQPAILALSKESRNLADAIQTVVAKEAADLVEFHGKDPKRYPEGINADRALAASWKNAGRRYKNNKCGLCKGPALACAKRHAHGKSCA